jgi:septum formation protein
MTRPGIGPLVLASSSAARLRVLRDTGIDPVVVVSGVDETCEPGLDTATMVTVLAERKASAVAALHPAALVLGCDSLLDVGGTAVGKPGSAEQAAQMWRRQAGREATLLTGHCLIDGRAGRRARGVASAQITFGTPSEAELAALVASGEPLRMAGGFSIEGRGGPFVETVTGHPSTVLGLSLPVLRQLLAELGLPITGLWRDTTGPSGD